MEYEIYVSGIGGQGVQLVAKVLALAAIKEDLHAMLSGFYGSEMRGGVSLSTVVIGDGMLRSLPVAAQVSAALVLHHHYWEQPRARLRDGALVVVDKAVAGQLEPMPTQRVVAVPATEIAIGIGNPMVAGLALLAAFGSLTGLVKTENLIEAMKESVPPHRRQHLEYNEKAIVAGTGAVTALSQSMRLVARERKSAA